MSHLTISVLYLVATYKDFFSTLGASLAVNVTAEAVGSRVISVKWDHQRACSHVNDLPASFRVQYTADKAIIASTTEIILTGLTPHTNYSIKVAVVNEMGDVGPYSYTVTIQTPEDGTAEA